MTAKLLAFPEIDMSDIPRMLRDLADRIEGEEYGDAINLAWAIDCGDGRVECGLMGQAPEPGLTAHYLMAIAQRKIEKSADI